MDVILRCKLAMHNEYI